MKRTLASLAVLALACAAFAAPITNVSVDSYSGRLGSSWDAPKSIDGSAATFWYSATNLDPQFIVYAFDQAYQVGDVSITMSSGNFRKLSIAGVSVSTDNVTFSPIGNFAVDVADGAVTTFSLGGASAMYIRIDGVEAFYNNWNPKYVTYPPDPNVVTDGKYAISFAEITFDAVPEPATMSLLVAGGLALIRRRR